MADANDNRLEGGRALRRLARPKDCTPYGARIANELRMIAAVAQLRHECTQRFLVEAVDVVERLADADCGNVGAHAQVARDAEAIRMDNAIAVGEDAFG